LNRFSLLFKVPTVTTGLNNAENQLVSIYKNENNRIVVCLSGNVENGCSATIYNALGQKIYAEKIQTSKTVLNSQLSSGVYVVTVQQNGKSTTAKVILK
jgi:hypothetical protein